MLEIAEKIKNNEATKEEKDEFFKAFNNLLDEIDSDVDKLL